MSGAGVGVVVGWEVEQERRIKLRIKEMKSLFINEFPLPLI
jgi:hypothetical protein